MYYHAGEMNVNDINYLRSGLENSNYGYLKTCIKNYARVNIWILEISNGGG